MPSSDVLFLKSNLLISSQEKESLFQSEKVRLEVSLTELQAKVSELEESLRLGQSEASEREEEYR
jgi:hypothetical protein